VAAGVAKANADHVLISGHDGGTGASPLSSIQAAGVPWEIGLAETQQTLLKNDLRSRITVQTDGQLKTGPRRRHRRVPRGRRVRLLDGAAHRDGLHHDARLPPEHVPGRHRHQDPELRKRFKGTPEHVVNFFFFVAEELRAIMAALGVRTVAELVGRTDLLEVDDAIDHWKARGVDLNAHPALPAARRRRPAPPRRAAAGCPRRPPRLGRSSSARRPRSRRASPSSSIWGSATSIAASAASSRRG
jgi:glutamate synthase (NADPH/NADH) large chain/glutamate synthase (ferredoxin)